MKKPLSLVFQETIYILDFRDSAFIVRDSVFIGLLKDYSRLLVIKCFRKSFERLFTTCYDNASFERLLLYFTFDSLLFGSRMVMLLPCVFLVSTRLLITSSSLGYNTIKNVVDRFYLLINGFTTDNNTEVIKQI